VQTLKWIVAGGLDLAAGGPYLGIPPSFVIPMTFRLLLAAVLAGLSGVPLCRAALTVSERLRCGHYQEIIEDPKQPHDGEWAFARFFLVQDKAAFEAAFKAAQSGDLLGKFIVMRCHRDGAGVKQDTTVVEQLDAELGKELAKKENASAAASYMLSYLSQEELKKGADNPKFSNAEEALKVLGKSSRERLFAAAEAGFAQAMCEAGVLLQKDEPVKAMAWYQKAAELGLAEAMKDVGYLLSSGLGGTRDPAEALRWTRKAAGLGDVDAMLNIVACFEFLHLPGITGEEVVSWINKAGATGHPIGLLEKGTALLRGTHGFKPDPAAGMALLQKAAGTGYPFVLGQLATCYGEGKGLPQNPRKAAEFAKAAWSQGNYEVVATIDAAYQQDKELAADTAAATYWHTLASRAAPKALADLDAKNPEILKALLKIDPFTLKVE
jgi:TPR repeat protein